MTSPSDAISIDARRTRLAELDADRAIVGLDPAEEAEAAGLARELGVDFDAAGLEETAARLAVAIGTATAAGPSMPPDLRDRLHASVPVDRVGAVRRFAVSLVAASLLVVGGVVAIMAGVGTPPPLDPATARAAFVADAPDLRTLRWQGTEHADVRRARDAGLLGGEVVWSDEASRGFVRVCHLAANDPATGQYQIWIWNGDELDAPPRLVTSFDVQQVADFTVVPIDGSAGIASPVRAVVTRALSADTIAPETEDWLLEGRWLPPIPREPSPGRSANP